MPLKWSALYELLPTKRRMGVGFLPPTPLILAAWWHTDDEMKMRRLREHIEWAESHGSLPEVFVFLSELSEGEWHHVGQ